MPLGDPATPRAPRRRLLEGDAQTRARHLSHSPSFTLRRSGTSTTSTLELPIGQLPLPNDLRGQALAGDYGVLQSFVVERREPDCRHRKRSRSTRIRAAAARPARTSSTATWCNRIKCRRTRVTRSGNTSCRRHGFVRVTIVTMPEAGSSLPAATDLRARRRQRRAGRTRLADLLSSERTLASTRSALVRRRRPREASWRRARPRARASSSPRSRRRERGHPLAGIVGDRRSRASPAATSGSALRSETTHGERRRTAPARPHSRSPRNAKDTVRRAPRCVELEQLVARATYPRNSTRSPTPSSRASSSHSAGVRRRRPDRNDRAPGSCGSARISSSKFLRRSTVPTARIVLPSPPPRSMRQKSSATPGYTTLTRAASRAGARTSSSSPREKSESTRSAAARRYRSKREAPK